MFSFLNLLWFFRETKQILFWLYLWQLKDYHIPRFLDHFRTHSGKKLFLNWVLFLKIILFFYFSAPVLLFLYIVESAVFLRQLFLKTYKKPVFTGKIIFLLLISFLFLTVFFAKADLKQLLIFDIFTPFIVSVIVLIFQPISVFARNRILKKASEKIKNLPNLKTIAITGSFGKTSTKEFLKTILSEKFKVVSTKEHQNSEIGIANCILNDLDEETEIFIAEMGAYKKGGIKLLCNMAKPQIGIVTGVNEQHLALFGSMENLLSAEGGRELSRALPKNGLLALNGDNKYCLDLYKKTDLKNKKIYAENRGSVSSDIWAEDITVHKIFISFVAINNPPTGGKEMAHFKVNVLGKQNVQNLLAGILVAKELGMNFGETAKAAERIRQEQAGMVLKHGKHGINIIDSSYSANPDGVFADLDYLNVFPNKKAIIMPCLIELGPKSSEIHQKIGRKIAEVCDLAVITSKDQFNSLKTGFDSVIARSTQGDVAIQSPGTKKILFCENPEKIFTMISVLLKSGDTVLLEGRVPQKLHELF